MEFEQAAEHASELIYSLPEGENIRIISHCDADGIASAAIMAISLMRAGYNFHISIKKTGTKIADGIGDARLAVFCDIGSTNLEELSKLNCRVILCDHHMRKDGFLLHLNVAFLYSIFEHLSVVSFETPSVLFIAYCPCNRKLRHIDIFFIHCKREGEGGGGAAYFAASVHAVCPGIHVYAVGEFAFYHVMVAKYHPAIKFVQFFEIRASYVAEYCKSGISDSICYFRPRLFYRDMSMMDSLEECIEPYFSNFSGGGALKFLQDMGIDPFKKFSELGENERKKLLSALTLRLMEQGAENVSLIRISPHGKNYGSLYDLSSKLNACAREGEEGVGIAACLGDGGAMGKAGQLQSTYREKIRREMRELEKEKVKELSSISYFHTKNTALGGVLAGLAMMYLPNFSKEKAVISVSTGEKKVDISGRGTERLVKKGLDLSEGMYVAAAKVGGGGGGHPIAAGATIPPGREEEFLRELDSVISKKMKRGNEGDGKEGRSGGGE